MLKLKCFFLLAICLVLASSSPIELEPYEAVAEEYQPVVSRHVRSPDGGSVAIDYSKDQRGREASVQYNHNLYTSRDGRGSVDAYAQGSRNFDQNRNNYGGGVQAKWKF